MKLKFLPSAVAALVSLGTLARAQSVVPVGAGSYAAYPPPQANAGSLPQTPPPYLVGTNRLPIPSNKWWTDVLLHQFAGNMWAQPLTVAADSQGVSVYRPVNWVPSGTNPQLALDAPVYLRGEQFSPADARALRWGDWTVTFRLQQSASQSVDVTLGRGLPTVWAEYTGVKPQVAFAVTPSAFFNSAGATISFPYTGSAVGVTSSGRHWAIVAPSNTLFALSSGVLTLTFPGANGFVALVSLPAKTDMAYCTQFAGAVPRDSRLSWTYDPAAGEVVTQWHLDVETLQGTQTGVIQGWLPHHYRETRRNFSWSPLQYAGGPRGLMRCATGTDFEITFPFEGILPSLPAPNPTGRTNDYSPARMAAYISAAAAQTGVAADTYWGGKDLLRYGQHLAMAKAMGLPEAATLQNTLRAALTNWFTYTPGEASYYFAAYPAWGALVGFKASYGSEQFNDQHFHYGYFLHAAALLGMYDRAFLTNYGAMATLVARDYANWDRANTNYAFLRTFDVWAGHSQASGFPDPTRGGNQESSSEAVQSWGGLFLLGAVLGDDGMRAAGAMGYAMESRAVREYWFNEYGDAWPAVYNKSVVGILWDNGQDYQTYFGGNPIYIHGIQWFPISPMLNYLARNRDFCRGQFNSMLAEQLASMGSSSISSMGAQWGNYALGYALQYDPDYVASQLDALYQANDPVAKDPYYVGPTYYFTHAYRALGLPQTNFHLSLPMGGVFYNPASAQFAYAAYNPGGSPQTATVFSNGVPIGSFVVPAQTLAATHALNGSGAFPVSVLSTAPAANAAGVATNLQVITLTFNQPVDPASTTGASISGPGVSNLRYASGEGTVAIQFAFDGGLQPETTYTITVPAGIKAASGTNTMSAPFTFSFTTAAFAAPPPLSVVSTVPAPNATGVSPELTRLTVTFNRSVSPASATGATISGPGLSGLTLQEQAASTNLTFVLTGVMQPLSQYTMRVPAATTEEGGTASLGSDYLFSFTTGAPEPAGENLVPNPGVEIAGAEASQAASWAVTQASGPVWAVRTNDNPRSGSWQFQVRLASAGAGPVVRTDIPNVPVTGGKTYQFLFHSLVRPGSVGGVFQWNVQWFDHSGFLGETGFRAWTPGEGSYSLCSNHVTSATGATAARLVFYCAGAASTNLSSVLDLDDLAFRELGRSTTQVTNIIQPLISAGVLLTSPQANPANYAVEWSSEPRSSAQWNSLGVLSSGLNFTNGVFEAFSTNHSRFYRGRENL